MPKISVIMSVYNGEPYLADCIESILSQTLKDFDFFITDDCSTDKSLEIIDKYKQHDKRIKVIENKNNIGLTRSLNRMIDISGSEYIARMDADDISRPMKLEKQVDFMQHNPNIGVCAVSSVEVGSRLRKNIRRGFFNHKEIEAFMLFGNPMPHAPSMIRGSLFYDQNIRYNENFKIIQDYELWQRLIKKTKFHILKEIHFEYRRTQTSVTVISSKKKNHREKYLYLVLEKELKHVGAIVSKENINTHFKIVSNNRNDYPYFLNQAHSWLDYLLRKNKETATYDEEIFRHFIELYWFKICTRSTTLGWEAFQKYRNSSLFSFDVGAKNISKLLMKCLVKHRTTSTNGYI